MNPKTKKCVQTFVVTITAILISISSSFLFQTKFHVSNEDAFRACDVARSKEIPYHVTIASAYLAIHQYSGALIHEKYVLTLMNPIFYKYANSPDQWKVVVGTRTVPYDDESYDLEKIIFPASYDTKTATDNIALIQLKKIVTFSIYVHQISLPDMRNTVEEGLKLFVSGFSLNLGSRGLDNIDDLQKYSMHVVSNKRCRKFYAGKKDLNFTGKFCAIADLGHRSCLSDEGSPATNVDKKYVIGIHMHKEEECSEKKKKPEIFVDVTSYLDFIKQSIKD